MKSMEFLLCKNTGWNHLFVSIWVLIDWVAFILFMMYMVFLQWKKKTASSVHKGRPYGGTGFVFSKSLNFALTPILKYKHDRVSVMKLNSVQGEILLINAYLPFHDTRNMDTQLLLYHDTVGYIDSILSTNSNCRFILLMDMTHLIPSLQLFRTKWKNLVWFRLTILILHLIQQLITPVVNQREIHIPWCSETIITDVYSTTTQAHPLTAVVHTGRERERRRIERDRETGGRERERGGKWPKYRRERNGLGMREPGERKVGEREWGSEGYKAAH